MKLTNLRTDSWVVALVNIYSYSNPENLIYQGTVHQITIQGTHPHYDKDWAFKFAGKEGYYEADTKFFRVATSEEIARHKLLGDMYTINVPNFNIGDKIKALSDVTTVDGEYTVSAESENIIEDMIINRKKPEDSIFWFNTNHSGVFRMSDNFEIIK